jgi:glycosyltransferase involved in cell wall biosynthesis
LNICYVAVDIAVPAPTGGSTHTLEMARALSEQGDSVCIVSRRERGQSNSTIINAIHIHKIYRLVLFPIPFGTESTAHFDEDKHQLITRVYDLYLRTVYAIYVAIRIARLIKKCNVQVVLERATSLGAGAIAARLTHRPLIVEVITGWYAPFSLRIAKRILAYSNEIIPEWVPRSKIIEVPAAVNTRLFNPMIDGEKIRRKYALVDKPVIAYSGGFWGFHGVDTIIDASKEVLARHPQSVFLMIGPRYNKYESYARSQGVADHFVFTGPVPYEEVPCFLAAADILLAPYSPKKHFGDWLWHHTSPIGTLKLLEYLALQKPVIASTIPPIAGFMKDGETGILVPPSDSKALCREINRLLEHPELAKQIAKKGHELVTEKYSWDYIAKALR